MTKARRPVFGWFVITDRRSRKEVDRIECDQPKGTRQWDRLEEGLLQKVDHETYRMEWKDAFATPVWRASGSNTPWHLRHPNSKALTLCGVKITSGIDSTSRMDWHQELDQYRCARCARLAALNPRAHNVPLAEAEQGDRSDSDGGE